MGELLSCNLFIPSAEALIEIILFRLLVEGCFLQTTHQQLHCEKPRAVTTTLSSQKLNRRLKNYSDKRAQRGAVHGNHFALEKTFTNDDPRPFIIYLKLGTHRTCYTYILNTLINLTGAPLPFSISKIELEIGERKNIRDGRGDQQDINTLSNIKRGANYRIKSDEPFSCQLNVLVTSLLYSDAILSRTFFFSLTRLTRRGTLVDM